MTPEFQTLFARLDAIDAKLAQITAAPALAPRIEYSRKEFAAMTGIPAGSLRHRVIWRRYGGKKVGGRIRFSEAARLAIAEGVK